MTPKSSLNVNFIDIILVARPVDLCDSLQEDENYLRMGRKYTILDRYFHAAFRDCWEHSEYSDLSKDSFAAALGYSRPLISEQLDGKKSSSPEFWERAAIFFDFDSLFDFLEYGKKLLEESGSKTQTKRPPRTQTRVVPFPDLKKDEKEILGLALRVYRSNDFGGSSGVFAAYLQLYEPHLPPAGRRKSPTHSGGRRASKI